MCEILFKQKTEFPYYQPTDALREEELVGGVLTLIFYVVCSHGSGSQQSGKLLEFLEELPYDIIHAFLRLPGGSSRMGTG